MPQIIGSVVKYPARASLGWYCLLIAGGTLLLSQRFSCRSDEHPIKWLEACFTATSAACVTGLSVRSTEFDFSVAGQLVILVLIQLGGIGIMTVTTYFMFQLGGRRGLRSRAVISETLGGHRNADLQWILTRVLGLTVVMEGLGFLVLGLRNIWDHDLLTALWLAMFHSISAFCNAGFALHDDSLVRYQSDFVVNLTISALIIVGGLGFPVILDMERCRKQPRGLRWRALLLHSKLMLIGTGSLLGVGMLAFLALEWDGVLRDLPWHHRPLIAFFHSVTCRTAGFNTVPVSSLTNATLFISILLMAIGAGPCSTGGGFKVSTIAVLWSQAWATFRGFRVVQVFGRSLPTTIVARATATAMLFTVLAGIALTIILVLEQSNVPHPESSGEFLDALFEVTSALGTVGLSTGLTAQLSAAGRIVLIILMLLGRLGPISVFVALSRSEVSQPMVFPDEEPLIG